MVFQHHVLCDFGVHCEIWPKQFENKPTGFFGNVLECFTPNLQQNLFDLRYRAGATLGLVGMEMECLRNNRYLDNDSRDRFEESYLLYRSAVSKLGLAAVEQKKTRWRQRPKSHALEHGVYDFNSKNLRYLANWLDEDFHSWNQTFGNGF